VLVDEHERAEAAPSRRDVRHEVPRPHMAGVGGLRGDAAGGVAAAWLPRLLLRTPRQSRRRSRRICQRPTAGSPWAARSRLTKTLAFSAP
jgi:hypothetical protein